MTDIGIFTFTRAEYSLYKPVLLRLRGMKEFNVTLCAGGAHLVDAYGMSVKEIKADGLKIGEKIDFIRFDKDGAIDVAASIAAEVRAVGKILDKYRFDLIVVLGDRWELLPLAYLAALKMIPVMHLGGGENTAGAIDNDIRHSVTMLSHYHCVTNSAYARNLMSMGVEKWRIAVTGAPGTENILKLETMSREEIAREFDLPVGEPYFLMTYHPETTGDIRTDVKRVRWILEFLRRKSIRVIVTYPNAEAGSERIIELLQKYESKRGTVTVKKYLGSYKYLSLMKHCAAVLGNSSSGIVEAPVFHVPTVNIGRRQEGRMCAGGIIQVGDVERELEQALDKVLYDSEFRKRVERAKSLYGDDKTSARIVEAICRAVATDRKILLNKRGLR
jgi:UDP-N-acetylglucosamine 2-epimerase (non-hydrolysing)/GDP/UDP-N,N'-diacetylbacillosamine 2-epimerase (hydrolysing)